MGLVKLRTYDSPIDAELAKSRLEAAGIQAFCFDENTINMGLAIGVRLMVNEADVAEAHRVVGEVKSPDAESDRITADAGRFRRNIALIGLVPLVAWLVSLWFTG
jgi:hypothetical protein